MSDVKKALEAAGEATWQRMDALGFDVPGDVHAQMIASAAIAAFLRALPNGLTLRWGDDWLADVDDEVMEALAAAVEAAALRARAEEAGHD